MTQTIPKTLKPLSKKTLNKWHKLLNVFTDEYGKPYTFTPTQIRIIDTIAKRRYPRTQLILPTQYGKSFAVALGIILRVTTKPEKWGIVAPSSDKARIIMDYIIDHVFDDIVFSEQLEFHDTKEKLKQHRSRDRISFRNGGEVRVFSADASNTKNTKKALMGYGGANIILDESAQINDELYSTVKRMLGGHKDNFLLEIGNPSFRNHFHRTWHGKRYQKIFVDCWMALKEGRYTEDFLNEMKEEAGFEWMYECKFPDSSELLPNGYRHMVSQNALEKALVDEIETDEDAILGIDVAGTGSNKTVYVVRFPVKGFAIREAETENEDPEYQADIAEQIIKKYGIKDYHIGIDAGGVGHGLAYILERRGYLIQKVLFGERKESGVPIDNGFANIKAQLFWRMRTWIINEGGRIKRDDSFMEVGWIAYKQNTALRVQIEPKEAMIKRKSEEGIKVESPDTADAFALTFIDTSRIVTEDDFDFD